MSRNTQGIINIPEKEYTLQGAGFPKYYLGADMKMLETPEKAFIMGSATYVKRCLTVYEQLLGEPPPKKIHAPLDPKDHPELDETAFLDDEGMRLYWKLLGMLQ